MTPTECMYFWIFFFFFTRMFSGCSPHIHMISLYAYLLTLFFSLLLHHSVTSSSSSTSSAFYMFHKYALFIWYLLLSFVTFWKYTLEVSSSKCDSWKVICIAWTMSSFSLCQFTYCFAKAAQTNLWEFLAQKCEDEMLTCDFASSSIAGMKGNLHLTFSTTMAQLDGKSDACVCRGWKKVATVW